MKRLWNEIVQLPPAQRAALLLAVRDGRTSITVLFSETRIASIREIAEAVGMSANEFAEILQDPPLDDLAIGHSRHTRRQESAVFTCCAVPVRL